MKWLKRVSVFLIAAAVSQSVSLLNAKAASTISLTIDGKAVQSSVAPVVQNGRLLVPVRVITEYLGAQVLWDSNAQKVTVNSAGNQIVFTIGSQNYTVNGSGKTLDSPAVIIGGSTMVPIRAISEAMGADVNYDSAKNLASVNYFSKGISGSVSMSGSSALYPLAGMAMDQFAAFNPNVSKNVAAGGSGTGLNNVLSGTVDIGNSDVYAEEKLKADDAATLVDHKVCLIGVSLIVNADVGVTVKNLTKDQLKGIFDGTITNWKEVGGPDEVIVVVNRPSSSGTRALFVKWALDGQSDVEGDMSLQTDDSNALLTTVGNTKGTIGYLALSYLTNSNPSIAKLQIDGVDATYDNIYNNKYQVWGYEHMYTKGNPSGAVALFLDYMTSSDIAAKAEGLGYGTISKLNAAAAGSR